MRCTFATTISLATHQKVPQWCEFLLGLTCLSHLDVSFLSQVAILHEPACRPSPSRGTQCAQPVAKETQPPSRWLSPTESAAVGATVRVWPLWHSRHCRAATAAGGSKGPLSGRCSRWTLLTRMTVNRAPGTFRFQILRQGPRVCTSSDSDVPAMPKPSSSRNFKFTGKFPRCCDATATHSSTHARRAAVPCGRRRGLYAIQNQLDSEGPGDYKPFHHDFSIWAAKYFSNLKELSYWHRDSNRGSLRGFLISFFCYPSLSSVWGEWLGSGFCQCEYVHNDPSPW